MPDPIKPAQALEGLHLEGGWTVTSQLSREPGATGGTFSVPYIVERRTGTRSERAFLKALDFTMVSELQMPLADALQTLTTAYMFERDIVLSCAGRRMSSVVLGIGAGEVTLDESSFDPRYIFLSSVPYIIFECANGDVRSAMTKTRATFDEAWSLRVLHGVANGLRQLHQAGIAHQDLKPSNVMTFDKVAKVGDLGRASWAEAPGLFESNVIAGDRTYAPPELLYGEFHTDARVRRRSCDMYHLGSMAVFLLTGAGLTPLLEAEIDPAFHWRTWPRDYRNVLPYIREAFDSILTRLQPTIHEAGRAGLTSTIRELSDPDPLVRGNPASGRGPSRYSMDRYVSIFDRLAKRAEIDLRRGY